MTKLATQIKKQNIEKKPNKIKGCANEKAYFIMQEVLSLSIAYMFVKLGLTANGSSPLQMISCQVLPVGFLQKNGKLEQRKRNFLLPVHLRFFSVSFQQQQLAPVSSLFWHPQHQSKDPPSNTSVLLNSSTLSSEV